MGTSKKYSDKKIKSGQAAVSNITIERCDELAEIYEYDRVANIYTVITRGSGGNTVQPGGRLLKGVPRKTQDVIDASPLPRGTVVLLRWSLGFPFIDGVLNVNLSKELTEKFPAKLISSDGSTKTLAVPDDASAQARSGYYKDPRSPGDLLEGDKVIMGPDGNYLGIMRGGYNVLSSGPDSKAKVETFKEQGLVRVTAEHFHIQTAFGTLKMYNTQGRCGIQFQGAVDQLTESGGDKERWTFKLNVGESGEYLTLEICDPDGHTNFKSHVTPQGKYTVIATDGIDMIQGGVTPSKNEYGGDYIRYVQGNTTLNTEKGYASTVGGTSSHQILGSSKKTVGGNAGETIRGDFTQVVQGSISATTSGGSPLTANPLNVAYEHQVLNGSYHLEVGNPFLGANPAAMAGINLAVNNGDVVIGQHPTFPATRATVSLNTLLPASVALGGMTNPASINPALFHGVLFEPLSSLLAAVFGMFDGHTHPATGTPPALLMSPLLTPSIYGVASQRVLLGG